MINASISFGYNSLDLKRIITKFVQMNLLVKNFCLQACLFGHVVTIATNIEVYNYVIFVQLKANLVGFFPTVRRTPTNLVDIVGCHGDMVTMATVSDDLFLYSSKGITHQKNTSYSFV